MSDNPWMEQHVAAEADFQHGSARQRWAVARKLVALEYSGMDEFARDCPCGGTLWYRATIGALACPHCGQLARTGTGELIPNTARPR